VDINYRIALLNWLLFLYFIRVHEKEKDFPDFSD